MKKIIFAFLIICNSLFGEIEYQFKEAVEVNKDFPTLYFTPTERIANLKVTVKGNGKPQVFNFSSIAGAATKEIVLKQKKGIIKYTVNFDGKYFDGKPIKDEVEMTGAVLEPFSINITKENVDLDNFKAKFSTNREAKKTEIKIYSPDNTVIFEDTKEFETPIANNIEVNWKLLNDEIKLIDIKVYDTFGFWVSMAINPISVYIPHEEVHFDSGKWDINESEIPKIKDSLTKIQEVLKKYGTDIDLKLYIIGCTDTMGSKESNITLSQNRAKAISEKFKQLGLKSAVYYTGVGEDLLKKQTEDDVDEVENRRVIYLISSHQPEISRTIKTKTWLKTE